MGMREPQMTVRAAAKEIGIAPTTLYRWIARGTVDAEPARSGVQMLPVSRVREIKAEVEDIKAGNSGVLPRAQRPKSDECSRG